MAVVVASTVANFALLESIGQIRLIDSLMTLDVDFISMSRPHLKHHIV